MTDALAEFGLGLKCRQPADPASGFVALSVPKGL